MTANGASKERPSTESIKQDAFAHDETGELSHMKKAGLLGNAAPETGIADQPKLAPPVRNIDAGKSEQASEPKQQDFESGSEAAEISSSFSSPVANSSGSAEQAAAKNKDVPTGLPQEESQSEQIEKQSGSEVPVAVEAAESGNFGNDASNNLTVDADVLSSQAFDAISERIERRNNEEVGGKLKDLTADDDFAAIQSSDPSTAAADEDDQGALADFGSHSSPSADAGNSGIPEETSKMHEPVGAQTEDKSRRGRRVAARILAVGAVVSACIFASKQFGATAWLIENARKIQAQYSLALPNSNIPPSVDSESSIEFIGDGEGRDVEFEFGSDSDKKTVGDLDFTLRIAEGIGNAPAADQAIANVESRAEYLAKPDGEVASARPAGRSNSESTYSSTLEPSEIDGLRNAPSENRSLDGASRVATVETGAELTPAGAANPADMQSFKFDAAVVERNVYDATQLPAASASSSSVARPLDVQAFFETADDIEEDSDSLLKVGTLHNGSANEMPGLPKESEQQDSLSRDNQGSPSKNSASPLSDEIVSFDPIPDASGETANATAGSSIFDDGDRQNSADLNSLRSELETEFAEIHSRFDLMAARFDLLLADHEPRSAVHDEKNASSSRSFESYDDTNVASEMNCQHSPDRSGQNCEARLRAGEGSQPYLIATAENVADGEFSMPEQGYGAVLDVLKDSAGGWLIIMENATVRLD